MSLDSHRPHSVISAGMDFEKCLHTGHLPYCPRQSSDGSCETLSPKTRLSQRPSLDNIGGENGANTNIQHEALQEAGPVVRCCSGSSARTVTQGHIPDSDLPYHVFGRGVTSFIVAIVSLAATLSGLSSNIFFPAQHEIAQGLSVKPLLINLSITTYLVAQAFAPSFWAPIADHCGRRVVLIVSLTIYVAANIVLALTRNVWMLLVFRALQAFGGTSTIALSAGIITDLTSPSTRGGYLGIFSGARQSSIALGPVLGGLLAGHLGWRWIFWFLVILSAISLILLTLFLPETLRKISGNGSHIPQSFWSQPLLSFVLPYVQPEYITRKYDRSMQARIIESSQNELRAKQPFSLRAFLQPFHILIEKDVACALLFGACVYTAWSMMTATTTVLLVRRYEFSTVQVGLCFLGNGIGCVLGSVFSGRMLNANFQREAQFWNYSESRVPTSPMPRPLPISFPIERARMSDAPMYSVIMVIGFLIFGWSLTPGFDTDVGSMMHDSAAHWMTPLLAQFMVGFSNTAVLNSNNTLVIDLFPVKSASASAVINLSRNLAAAVGVALVDFIEDGTSPGWLGVSLAGLVVIGAVPLTVHHLYGARWRVERQSSHA